MNFKDMVEADIDEVFLNLDEFGEIHELGGKQVNVIVDENEMIYRERKTDVHDREFKQRTLIYVKPEDLDKEPRINQPMSFDGKKYLVKDVTKESGMYSLLLEVGRN